MAAGWSEVEGGHAWRRDSNGFEMHTTLQELLHFWRAHVQRIWQDRSNAHLQRFRQDKYNRVRFLVWRWKMLAIMETYIKEKVFAAWAHEVCSSCPRLVSSSSSDIGPGLVSSSSSDIGQPQDDPDDASDSSSDCSAVAVRWML